jgi:DUF4097 and DUF4098 domain-containing protein YvlB
MTSRRLSLSLIFATILLTLPAVARDSYQGSFERTLQVSDSPSIEVLTHSGDVTIRAGSSGVIQISGKIRVEDRWINDRKDQVTEIENHPPIRQDGSNVKVDYVNGHGISVSYEITLPANTSVRTETGSGNVTVEGLQRGIETRSGSGDLRLENISGTIRAKTGSGNITGSNLSGPLNVEASSGDLRLEETGSADVSAQTGSGNIEIRGIHGGARVTAGSGNVEVEGQPTSNWTVNTGSGNAEVKISSQAGYELEVSTGSGNITTDEPITTTVQGRIQSPSRSIRGQVRGGGPTVSVHTGSGDVRIR